MAVLAAWSTTAAAMVAWVLSAVLPRDEVGTASIATKEDNSRFTTDVLLVSACIASLVGVGFALVKAANEHGMAKAVTTGLAVLSVVLSWAVVHVVYLLHYARLYYEEDGGIQFIGENAPDYRDFAYLAFTIGMTYQVSDTDLTSRPIRRAATHHALLSYLFGTVIRRHDDQTWWLRSSAEVRSGRRDVPFRGESFAGPLFGACNIYVCAVILFLLRLRFG